MQVLPRPLRHARLFILELVTISVGLLIALGIDSLVEWRREVRLAENAEVSLLREIRKNAAKLDEKLPQIEASRQRLKDGLDAINRYREPGAEPRSGDRISLELDFSFFEQQETSWQSAQSTRAIDFMPYQQVEKYNTLYSGQAELMKGQEVVLEDLVQASALIKRLGSAEEMKPTPEELGLLVERINVWQLHVVFLYNKARLVSGLQHAFLEGKPFEEVRIEDSFDGLEISSGD